MSFKTPISPSSLARPPAQNSTQTGAFRYNHVFFWTRGHQDHAAPTYFSYGFSKLLSGGTRADGRSGVAERSGVAPVVEGERQDKTFTTVKYE